MTTPDDYPWITSRELRTLRGMIIDRDAAWRADPKWSKIIDAEIRKGIENIDGPTFKGIYDYIRYGNLPGIYKTWGFGPVKMEAAWKEYLEHHNVVPPSNT